MDSGGCGNIMGKRQTSGMEPSLEVTELMPTIYKVNLIPRRQDLSTEYLWRFVTPFVSVIYLHITNHLKICGLTQQSFYYLSDSWGSGM